MAKKEKKQKSPSLVVALILGVLTVLLGLILGSISLMSQKVIEVPKLPEPEERVAGAVYYVKGSDAPGARWRTKRNQLIRGEPGVISLGETDLNDWARTQFKPEAPKEGEEVEKPSFLGLELHLSPPNFRIADGELQISSYIELPQFSKSRKFVYQARGHFVKSGDGGFSFRVEEGSIGKAPLLNVPGLGGIIHSQLQGYFKNASEWSELEQHWKKATNVEIDGNQLQLTL